MEESVSTAAVGAEDRPPMDLSSVPLAGPKSPTVEERPLDTSDDDDDSEYFEQVLHTLNQKGYKYSPVSTETMCTREEAMAMRDELRRIGMQAFVDKYFDPELFNPLKVFSAFAINVPESELENPVVYRAIGIAMHRELLIRRRLPDYNTFEDAVELLKSSKNVLVITGAGISTSLGIPDFRSKETGFYSKLRDAGIAEPEELFSLENFDFDPKPFYTFAHDLLPPKGRFTPTHQFIRLLQDRGVLLRNYTQNIDNIEAYAGIKSDKVLHCHGSWATATCRICKTTVPGDTIFESIQDRSVAYCTACVDNNSLKRKRPEAKLKPRKKRANDDFDDDDEDDDMPQVGVMKPDITFFGEALPDKFFDTLNDIDRPLVDLVIVIGTSLKVKPVSMIPDFVRPEVPQMYISREAILDIAFDLQLLGDCDTIVAELCRAAGEGWELKHDMLHSEAIKAKIVSLDEVPGASVIRLPKIGGEVKLEVEANKAKKAIVNTADDS